MQVLPSESSGASVSLPGDEAQRLMNELSRLNIEVIGNSYAKAGFPLLGSLTLRLGEHLTKAHLDEIERGLDGQ